MDFGGIDTSPLTGGAGGIVGAFEAKTGVDVPDAVEDAAEEVAEAVEAAAPSIEEICGDEIAPLKKAQEVFEGLTKALDGPAEKLSGLSDFDSGADPDAGPVDQIVSLASAFQERVTGMLADPESLLPPGAGCVAASWQAKVEKELGRLAGDVKGIEDLIRGLPAEIASAVQAVLAKVREVATRLLAALRAIAALPAEALAKVQECFAGAPSDALQRLLDLPDQLTGVSRQIKAQVKQLDLKGLGEAKKGVAGVLLPLEGAEKRIVGFTKNAPGRVRSAFKPPAWLACCLGCAGGEVGEAQQKLDEALGALSSGADLSPLRGHLEQLRTRLEALNVDAKPLQAALAGFARDFDGAVKPAAAAAKTCRAKVEAITTTVCA